MTSSSNYSNRAEYRSRIVTDLAGWRTEYQETELLIFAEDVYAEEAYRQVVSLRQTLEEYIAAHPDFAKSLSPLKAASGAPDIIVSMCRAANIAGVGPMAAVAGAFAEHVGTSLLKHSGQVIVENGGDVFIKTDDITTAAIYAGNSTASMRIGIAVNSRKKPVAVCTSSGTVGPSKSLGKADAAVVVSYSACLADACATRLGNEIRQASDIQGALEMICALDSVIIGAVAVIGDTIGAAGDIELISL